MARARRSIASVSAAVEIAAIAEYGAFAVIADKNQLHGFALRRNAIEPVMQALTTMG